MALTVNFKSPKTSTTQVVNVSGDPVYIAIVPKLNTTGETPDTVTLTSAGSLLAQIQLAP
ncbi:hypothetical protein [Clostridium oryzae]|uniref:Uncharacterized protein n=1 Tax=Clostridium oryzae TaxID=1450648 RepID=A0A1V4ISY1_9CLOT|nr:hypothetical protein [Clostridium oryzae]OPJ63013.1 hypothetical protein CLORY_13790 [Clostridium oryzae]